ncbi:MAG: helix-turn-helix domain-containing protein [Defluviitaleaceae bacterium]|nr:helix-turn-helix domain-containing protein [Defluviitaleaceae bacterium]
MNRIKELREENNLKQLELAEMLNVSQGTLSNWERSVHDPDRESLIKMSTIFSRGIDYILGNLFIHDDLKDVQVAFNRGEFEDLTQDEVNKLAEFAKFIKTQRA